MIIGGMCFPYILFIGVKMYEKIDIIEHAILLNPKYIKIFRQKLKITQSKLAEESGVSQSHLSMLEKGKRPATKSNAAAITLGLLKCSNIWDKEDPIHYLLDVLSLTKLEGAIVNMIEDIVENKRCLITIEGYPVIIITKEYLQEYLKNKIKVINIEKVEFYRGRLVIFGKYSDNKEVSINLDCSDIRRLEKKIKNKLNKNTIIQIFTKDEVPPIYNTKRDSIIIHCW